MAEEKELVKQEEERDKPIILRNGVNQEDPPPGDMKDRLVKAETPILPPPEDKKPVGPGSIFIAMFTLGVFFIILIVIIILSPGMLDPDRVAIVFNRYNIGDFYTLGEPEGEIFLGAGVEGSHNQYVLAYEYNNYVDKFTGVANIKLPMNYFKSIKIRIKSRETRTLALSVDELGGAVYLYVFEAPAGEWMDITALPEDFVISGGMRDDNNQLDADDLNTRLVIADLSGDKGIVGENVFWIDRIDIERMPRQERKE